MVHDGAVAGEETWGSGVVSGTEKPCPCLGWCVAWPAGVETRGGGATGAGTSAGHPRTTGGESLGSFATHGAGACLGAMAPVLPRDPSAETIAAQSQSVVGSKTPPPPPSMRATLGATLGAVPE